MDWDNDGRKDLLTGERYGFVRLYLNTGTDPDPEFSGFTYLRVGSGNIDVGYSSSPDIVDWNSDGKKDLIVGDDNGNIWLFINEGTDADPVFNSSSFIRDGSMTLDVGSRASPVAADWNRDGKKDLLVGETYGNIFYFENQGTDADPVFSGSTRLQAAGKTIDVGYYPRFDIADWDNDGVLDILCGYYDYYAPTIAGVFYFHALGPLSVDANTISASAGGSIGFSLDAGAAFGHRSYVLIGSASGTEPGTVLPGGGLLPLNLDSFSSYTYNHPGGPVFQNFSGALDMKGEAKASGFRSGPVPFLAGTILNFAYTTTVPFDFQSNAVSVEVLP